MSSNTESPPNQSPKIILDSEGKPLKPCCACPETRLKRDQCVLMYGEEMCADVIMEHKECLRKLGFADSSDQKPTARFRVTGSMLPNLVGRDVCIVGTALRVAPSGQRIHIRCADGREINCNLLSPLQASPENRVIEVQGRVSNVQGTEINATAEPVVFSQEASTKFDSDLYSQAIQMTAQFDQFYIQPMEA
ncbi:unnamed protein product [Schistosoma curassoni]|uniref:Cytochrome c oxidase copper chaperone n=1 Tax=Schistosoma curassoni TaxID=6186 RepID=A0A183JG55_9TREM|nr:unnamed protein product [Schistosoma curassoni]